jgi:hypothetical protein
MWLRGHGSGEYVRRYHEADRGSPLIVIDLMQSSSLAHEEEYRSSEGLADAMGTLRRKVPSHYIPIHPANVSKNDWVILLEAGTIVGPSGKKLRVAQATQERRIVKKYNLLLRAQHYVVIEGYDPRIHALYFCPQLYQFDADRKLVPLQGEQMGELVVQAVQGGVVETHPWYDPLDKLPTEPIIKASLPEQFDTVVVEGPKQWATAAE